MLTVILFMRRNTCNMFIIKSLGGKMKRLRLTTLLLVTFICLLMTQANAETIVSVPQGTPGAPAIMGNQYLMMSWTASQAYADVVISAPLYTISQDHNGIVAYLTNQIGPGTTAASNEIASINMNIPVNETATYPIADVTLFSGLSLEPGTYYLTLAAPVLDGIYRGWENGSSSSIMTAPGVTVAEKAFWVWSMPCNGILDPSYAPASTFGDEYGLPLAFSVTGTAVPEPATLLFLGFGLIGLPAVIKKRFFG